MQSQLDKFLTLFLLDKYLYFQFLPELFQFFFIFNLQIFKKLYF